MVGGRTIFDTVRARYVWEWPPYPQYYIPIGDVDSTFLVDEHEDEQTDRGPAGRLGLRAGDIDRPRCVLVYRDAAEPAVAGTARFEWSALDAWYEEDERIFVHPRNPYARVDAVRSHRRVRVELDGVLLAESDCPVLVFETGLPTRYYFDRTSVAFDQLRPTDTQTACPYKGTTSSYWAAATGSSEPRDLAWTYDFPTRQLLPVAGLVAFFNERVDVTLDGVPQPRPVTPFS